MHFPIRKDIINNNCTEGNNMNISKLLQQLDFLISNANLKEAENLLNQELPAANEAGRDFDRLIMLNELIGIFRVTGRASEATEIGDDALSLISVLHLTGSKHHATTLVNAATANLAAGKHNKAISLYVEAENILKKLHLADTYDMAALYNNMSQLYQAEQQHRTAIKYQELALSIIQSRDDAKEEAAISKTNIGYSYIALLELDTAAKYLQEACSFFETEPGKRNPHYASTLSALGHLFYLENNYKLALKYFQESLALEQSVFQNSHAADIILKNIEKIKSKMQKKESP